MPGVPVGVAQGERLEPVAALQHGGEQDPVVRRVPLLAEHGDPVAGPPRDELLDEPHGGHPVADDDDPLPDPRGWGAHVAHRRGADLELRHPRGRVERVVGEPVDARPSGTARRRCPGGSCRRPGPARSSSPRRVATVTRSPSTAPIRSASIGCISTKAPASGRSRCGGSGRRTGTARARGRWSGAAGSPAHGCSAAPRCSTRRTGRGRPGWRSARRTAAACPGGRGRAGPEDAVLGADPVVGDAGVVGRPARGGPAQLVEHLLRVGRERHRRAQALGQPGEHVEVAAHTLGRRDRALRAGSPGPRGWSWCRSPPPTA